MPFLQISHALDEHYKRAVKKLMDEKGEIAMLRYVEANARRAEGEWYDHCTKRTGFSGKLRFRAYRTRAGNLRAKVGSDAHYVRYLNLVFPANKRVIDKTLTDPMRRNISTDFKAELSKAMM
jgi:hypothetical protein